MGDHRASIKCTFEMHGHKATQDWWINQDTEGCDRRVIEWFDRQVEIAMGRYGAANAEYEMAREAEAREAADRAEYARLRAKFEPTEDQKE